LDMTERKTNMDQIRYERSGYSNGFAWIHFVRFGRNRDSLMEEKQSASEAV